MKKLLLIEALLCAAVFLFMPQISFAYQTFTSAPSGGCLQCHTFAGGAGEQHVTHSVTAAIACSNCHPGGTPGVNVLSSACAACHPASNPGVCGIINTVTSHPKTGTGSCLLCHATCASPTPGACQNWLGSWHFTYSSTINTNVCVDNTTINNEIPTLCTDDSEPNCVCIDNVTSQTLCIDNATLQQCTDDSAANCVCFANPFYKTPSVPAGSYAVVMNTAQENFTAQGLTFSCLATGTRTTDSKPITIGQPDNATLAAFAQYFPNIIANGTYIVYEGTSADIKSVPFAQIPKANFMSNMFTTSPDYNFLGLVFGTKDNATTECTLTIIPGTIFRLLAFAQPFSPFIIYAPRDSNVAFARPLAIDWGTDALIDLIKIRVGKKIIVGFGIARPFLLAAGNYTVTVTYGDNETTACGTLQVR